MSFLPAIPEDDVLLTVTELMKVQQLPALNRMAHSVLPQFSSTIFFDNHITIFDPNF
jgi:hypothetical protein